MRRTLLAIVFTLGLGFAVASATSTVTPGGPPVAASIAAAQTWIDAGVAGAIRPATANTSIRATCPLVIQLTDGGTAFVVDCDGSIDYSSYPTMGRNAFGVDTTGLVYGNGFAAYDYLGNYAGITAGTVSANGSALSTPTIAYQSAAGLLWRLNSSASTADLKSETGGVAFVGHAYSPYVIAGTIDAGFALLGGSHVTGAETVDGLITANAQVTTNAVNITGAGSLQISSNGVNVGSDGPWHASRFLSNMNNDTVGLTLTAGPGVFVDMADFKNNSGTVLSDVTKDGIFEAPKFQNPTAANPVKIQGQVSNNNVAVAELIDNSVSLLVDGGLLTKWTNNTVQVADVRANGTLDLLQGQGICFPSGNCQSDVASTISGLTPAAVVYANSPTTLGTDATTSGMYIDSANHRVAVGTTAPQTPFEVKISGAYAISTPTGFTDAEGNTGVGEQFGNLTITKSGTTDATFTLGASGSNQGLFLQAANVLGTGDVSVRVLPTATSGWAIFRDDVTSGVSAGVALASSSSSAPVSIAPNKVRALTAFNGGNISIGSTTDQSKQLYVNGTTQVHGAATFDSTVASGAITSTSTVTGTGFLISADPAPVVTSTATQQGIQAGVTSAGTNLSVTFSPAFSGAPFCTCGEASGNTGNIIGRCNGTSTTLTITNSLGSAINYICIGPR